MSEQPQPIDRLPVDPRVAAAFDDMKPYLATAAIIGLFGAPTEVVVPIVRRLRNRPGVSLGPGIVVLANALVGLGAVRFFRKRPELWGRLRNRPVTRWVLVLPLYRFLSPAVAASWQGGVVLRRHSALWGGALSPVGLLQAALLAVTLCRARQAKRTS